VAFLFAVPSLILYSQGYRIDWKAKRIVQTGAFYFKAIPSRADILINEKLLKTTDFFFGSALLGNLLPGSYQVQIAKEGYQSWQKQLEITEKGVTDAKNIILFPQNPEFRIATDHVQQVWQTPQEKTLLLQKDTPEKTWKLVFLNLETTGEETIFTSKNKEHIWNIQWSSDGTHILLSLVSGESIRSLVLSLQKDQSCSSSPCDLAFLGESIDTVMFSPNNRDRIIFTKFLRNTLVLGEADYVKQEVLAPLGNNVVTFTVAAESLFWLESDGKLWRKDTGSQNPDQILSSLSYPVKQETEYSIHAAENMIFLKEDTKLLQVQQTEKTFKEVFSGGKTLAVSPDRKKLALSNDSEIWILYFQDSGDLPLHKAGDKVFLTRLSKNIKNLSWLSSHYLVFSSENEVKVIEIDDRSTANIADLAQFEDPKLLWQETSKILAALSKGNLYISYLLRH
jgi:hypothetical protein